MENDTYLTKESSYSDIADAIRESLDEDTTYTPLEMPEAIRRIGGQKGDEFWEKGGGPESNINAKLKDSSSDVLSNYSVAEGYGHLIAFPANYSHAEGSGTTILSEYSHTEGQETFTRIGNSNHAEGYQTLAEGTGAHAEGYQSSSLSLGDHAEGVRTIANSVSSTGGAHAEGYETYTAEKEAPHAEGYKSTAAGNYSHSEGFKTYAQGNSSHTEGAATSAFGVSSHAEGNGTYAAGAKQHVEGAWNTIDTENKYAHIVGNGTGESDRKNISTLDWEGNGWFAGDVTATAEDGHTISLRELDLNRGGDETVTFNGIPSSTDLLAAVASKKDIILHYGTKTYTYQGTRAKQTTDKVPVLAPKRSEVPNYNSEVFNILPHIVASKYNTNYYCPVVESDDEVYLGRIKEASLNWVYIGIASKTANSVNVLWMADPAEGKTWTENVRSLSNTQDEWKYLRYDTSMNNFIESNMPVFASTAEFLSALSNIDKKYVFLADDGIQKSYIIMNEDGTYTIENKEDYQEKIASADTLGSVKIGEGLNITGDGTVSIDEESCEEWTFTLEDGSTVTKKVVLR